MTILVRNEKLKGEKEQSIDACCQIPELIEFRFLRFHGPPYKKAFVKDMKKIKEKIG